MMRYRNDRAAGPGSSSPLGIGVHALVTRDGASVASTMEEELELEEFGQSSSGWMDWVGEFQASERVV
jgi:hypothetical protein